MLAFLPSMQRISSRSAGLVGGSVEGVHDDYAALHYEFDLAGDGDVGEGFGLNGDEVGPSRLPSQLRASKVNPSRLREN